MRKGFIFTIDAILAVLVAVSLMVVLVSMQQTEKGKEKAFEVVAQKARDKAITQFYSLSAAASDSVPSSNQYYYCTKVVRYETVVPDNAQSARTAFTKCGGFG